MRGQQNPSRRFRHKQLGYIGIAGRRVIGGGNSRGDAQPTDIPGLVGWWKQGDWTSSGERVSDWNDSSNTEPAALAVQESFVDYPGTDDYNATTPSAAANQITGDISILARIAPDTWVGGGPRNIVSKYRSTLDQRAYNFRINIDGELVIEWSTDGTASGQLTRVSTGAVPGTDGEFLWVMASLEVSNAGNRIVTFRYAADQDGLPTSWTQLSSHTTAVTTSIHPSTADVEIGSVFDGSSSLFPGKIKRVLIYSGLVLANGTGGTKKVDYCPQGQVAAATTWTSPVTGEVWTQNNTAVESTYAYEPYVAYQGVSGQYASAPDNAAFDITGDISIAVRVAMDDWTPGAVNTLVGKYISGTSQVSYLLYVNLTTGVIRLVTSPDGTNAAELTGSSTAAPTVSNADYLWVMVSFDVDDGGGNRVYKFYTAPDSATLPTAWTQLGTTVTTAGATSIFNSTTALTIGGYGVGGASSPLSGRVKRAILYSGVVAADGTGGTMVADYNPSIQADAATTWVSTSPTGETWTQQGATMVRDSKDLRQYSGSAKPIELPWSGENYAWLPGVSGNYLSTSDSAALDLTTQLSFIALVSADDWTPGAQKDIIAKWNGTGNQRAYQFSISNTNVLNFNGSTDGASANISATSSIAPTVSDFGLLWVMATIDVTNAASGANFYTAPATSAASLPTSWTQLGTAGRPVTGGGAVTLFNSTASLEVGSINAGTSQLWAGKVKRALVYSGIVDINGAGGTLVADCNPTLQPEVNPRVNLLTYTEDLSNAAWTKTRSSVLSNLLVGSETAINGLGTTITSNAAVAPDGKTTMDLVVEQATNQLHYPEDIAYVIGSIVTHTFSAYVKQYSGSRYVVLNVLGSNFATAYFDLSTGTVASTSGANYTGSAIELIEGTTCRISLTVTLTSGAGTSFRVQAASAIGTLSYLGDGTSGYYLWGRQLVVGSTPQTYAPTSSATAPIPFTGPTVNGRTVTLMKIVEDTAAANNHVMLYSTSSVLPTQAQTLTCYLKAAERTWVQLIIWDNSAAANQCRVFINLSTGALGTVANGGNGTGASATVEDMGSGIYRVKLSGTPNNSGTASGGGVYIAEADNDTIYNGDGVSGIYAGGLQLEASASATTYAPVGSAWPTWVASTGELWSINATGAKQAQIVGSPQIVGDDSAMYMRAVYDQAQPLTRFVLYRRNTTTAASDYIYDGAGGPFQNALIGLTSSLNLSISAGGAVSTVAGPSTPEWAVQGGVFNGASSFQQVNGTLGATGNALTATSNGMTLMGTGAGTPTNLAPVQIKEVIEYNRALSTTEVTTVLRYLSRKGNLGLAI